MIAALIGAVLLYIVAAIPWEPGMTNAPDSIVDQFRDTSHQNETRPKESGKLSQLNQQKKTGYIPHGYYGGHRCPMMGYW